jgi:putative glycosyltransferase (TIGR04372 family)
MLPAIILNRRFYITDIPNVERLGHAVANVDILQAEFSSGMYKTKAKERTLLIFYPQISEIEDVGFVYFNKISFIRQISKSLSCKNIHILYVHPWLEKMLKRFLLKTGSSFFFQKPYGHRDIFNLLCKSPSLYSLSGNEEKYCIKYFEDKNLKIDRPLILCSNRSSGNINFNETDGRSLSENKRYGYRNSSFVTLKPAIQHLLDKGYTVVKVGSASGSHRIFSDSFFDFSAQPTTEKNILLDLFLFSRCLFFFGDTSGNYSLAQAFRKPICFFNFVPFGHFHSWDKNSISIFKNVKDKRTGELQRFRKILKYQYGYEIHNEKANSNLKYISNTTKEISETVKEMEVRISGGSYRTDEDLQRRFQKLFTPSYLHQSVNARCGDYFLKKYKHLL